MCVCIEVKSNLLHKVTQYLSLPCRKDLSPDPVQNVYITTGLVQDFLLVLKLTVCPSPSERSGSLFITCTYTSERGPKIKIHRVKSGWTPSFFLPLRPPRSNIFQNLTFTCQRGQAGPGVVLKSSWGTFFCWGLPPIVTFFTRSERWDSLSFGFK